MVSPERGESIQRNVILSQHQRSGEFASTYGFPSIIQTLAAPALEASIPISSLRPAAVSKQIIGIGIAMHTTDACCGGACIHGDLGCTPNPHRRRGAEGVRRQGSGDMGASFVGGPCCQANCATRLVGGGETRSIHFANIIM